MRTIAVFDPPMCCPTGVCGPGVDPVLPRLAADLDWLARHGVTVERYNLGQQPAAFARTPVVVGALREHGNDCLPLVLADGRIVSRGTYPERAELARFAGLEAALDEAPTAAGSPCCAPGLVTIGRPGRPSGGCC